MQRTQILGPRSSESCKRSYNLQFQCHKLLHSTLQRLAENNVLVEATGGPTGSSLHHSATNQRISCSAPSAYMAELRDEPGFPMQAVLSSHLIPHGPDSGLWSDDYERFLLQRLERVGAAIAQTTGATHEKPALVR